MSDEIAAGVFHVVSSLGGVAGPAIRVCKGV